MDKDATPGGPLAIHLAAVGGESQVPYKFSFAASGDGFSIKSGTGNVTFSVSKGSGVGVLDKIDYTLNIISGAFHLASTAGVFHNSESIDAYVSWTEEKFHTRQYFLLTQLFRIYKSKYRVH